LTTGPAALGRAQHASVLRLRPAERGGQKYTYSCDRALEVNVKGPVRLFDHHIELVLSIEGFRLQVDRLLVGRIILVSGEIFFIFMIMNNKKTANIAQISRKSEICALFAFF